MRAGVKRILDQSSLLYHKDLGVTPAKVAKKEDDRIEVVVDGVDFSENKNSDHAYALSDFDSEFGSLCKMDGKHGNYAKKTKKTIKMPKSIEEMIRIYNYKKTLNSSEEEKHDMVCCISIESDDEERKLNCGGYIKAEKYNLPQTETSSSLTQYQMEQSDDTAEIDVNKENIPPMEQSKPEGNSKTNLIQ